MRARGPRFAWWVIPSVLGMSLVLGAGVKLVTAGHYVDADDVAAPAGYEKTKLGRDAIDRFTLERDFPVLRRWALADVSHSGGLTLGRLADVQRVDDQLVSDLERNLREHAGTKFATHVARMETLSGQSVAHLELTDGDRRLRVGVLRIADETIVLTADSSERDDAQGPPFAQMLDSLTRVQPRRRSPSPYEIGYAMGGALIYGIVLCVPLAFLVSVHRRRAFERAELDRIAPADALAAGPKPKRRGFAWPVLVGGLVIGGVAGGAIAARRGEVALVESTDVHAPAGYMPTSNLPPPDHSVVLLGSWANAPKSLLWVTRVREPIDPSQFSMDRTLAEVEGGARAELEKHRITAVAKREVRQIAGRAVGVVELRMPDGLLQNATMVIGRSSVSVGAASPLEDVERQRAGFDALLDQVAHLQPRHVGEADRYTAAGAGSACGLMIALLPSIGLAAVLRRRR